MKKIILVSFISLISIFEMKAQNFTKEEILVYFKSGLKKETTTNEKGTLKKPNFSSKLLVEKLKKLNITIDQIELAFPDFKERDTLKILENGEEITQLNFSNLCRIKLKSSDSKYELIDKLNIIDEVLYAEPNGKIIRHEIPNDEFLVDQWNIKNDFNIGSDIHAINAWDIYKGNSNNYIGIIDGGVEPNNPHPDLNGKLVGGDTGFGWDSHGIHVAGIAAANSNNNFGISGVDWNAKIYSKRIDNLSDDVSTYQAIINVIDFNPNVFVLNNSWSLAYNDETVGRYSTTIAQAFATAYKANRVSIASMGNHQLEQPNVIAYPAGLSNVVAVGATNSNDEIANFSAQGSHIDISAPGVGIISTVSGNNFMYKSGTSMAAPHVAGVASLLKGYKPELTNDDIVNIIKLSADDVNSNTFLGFDPILGAGRLNAHKALMLLNNPYKFFQGNVGAGTVFSSTTKYSHQFIAATSLLSTGTYLVKRYEVRKSVSFPDTYCSIKGVWGRGNGPNGKSGWNLSNPNFGEGFCEVVPGTLTNNGVTLRTYVYEVFSINGQNLGYFPTAPQNVRFKYSLIGIPSRSATISGSSQVCNFDSDLLYTDDLNNMVNINWVHDNKITIVNGQGTNQVTIKSSSYLANGYTTITAMINECVAATKTLWVGVPSLPSSIFGTSNPTYNSSQTYFISNPPNGSTSIDWDVPLQPFCPPPQPNSSFGPCINWSITSNENSNYVNVIVGGYNGQIKVKGINECGIGPISELTLTVPNNSITSAYCPCGYIGGEIQQQLSIYPNPASEELNLEISNIDEFLNSNRNFEEINIEVRLLNYNYEVIRKYYFTDRIMKINTKSLKEGLYFLVILKNDFKETRLIQIKH